VKTAGWASEPSWPCPQVASGIESSTRNESVVANSYGVSAVVCPNDRASELASVEERRRLKNRFDHEAHAVRRRRLRADP